eukprot:Skav235644  [mRNA]  locus=scaffold358:579414:580891:- [translate_table: standard]
MGMGMKHFWIPPKFSSSANFVPSHLVEETAKLQCEKRRETSKLEKLEKRLHSAQGHLNSLKRERDLLKDCSGTPEKRNWTRGAVQRNSGAKESIQMLVC